MRRKSFGNMQCPIARSLERVGEWWSILILRDASLGLTRFDEFQESLGIAPNMLARRLKALVEAGLLDMAPVVLLVCNWAAPSHGSWIESAGTLGETTRMRRLVTIGAGPGSSPGTALTVAWSSLAMALA